MGPVVRATLWLDLQTRRLGQTERLYQRPCGTIGRVSSQEANNPNWSAEMLRSRMRSSRWCRSAGGRLARRIRGIRRYYGYRKNREPARHGAVRPAPDRTRETASPPLRKVPGRSVVAPHPADRRSGSLPVASVNTDSGRYEDFIEPWSLRLMVNVRVAVRLSPTCWRSAALNGR